MDYDQTRYYADTGLTREYDRKAEDSDEGEERDNESQ